VSKKPVKIHIHPLLGIGIVLFFVVFSVFATVFVLSARASSLVTFTGCIRSGSGSVYDAQLGNTPLNPCKTGDSQFTGSNGTITSVTTSGGLTGGGSSGDLTLSILDGGVTNPKLADSSVDSLKLADGAVTQNKISNSSSEPSLVTSWENSNDVPLNALGPEAEYTVPTSITLTVPPGKAYNYVMSYSGWLRYNFSERNGNPTGFHAKWNAGILANGVQQTFLNQIVFTGVREDWAAVGGNDAWLTALNTSWNMRLTEGTYSISIKIGGYSDNTMTTAHFQQERLYITRID